MRLRGELSKLLLHLYCWCSACENDTYSFLERQLLMYYSRCLPATTQYCPRQCSHQKRSRMAAWWSLQRSFSSFY